MQPPSDLEAEGMAAFEHSTTALVEIGEDPALSRGAVERYCRAVDMLGVIRRAWDADGRPTTALGSRRQLIRHPLVAAVEAQERHVMALAEALLLTSASRARAQRAGWRKGHARASDRQPRGLRVAT